MTFPWVRSFAFWVGVRATRLSLRTLGFAKTVAALGVVPRFRGRRSVAAGNAHQWADMIDRVSGRPYGGTCLDRSVFLWFVMRLHGLDGFVRIGITLDGGAIDGHAWVEIDGRVINDEADVADSFAVFDEDPVGIVFR